MTVVEFENVRPIRPGFDATIRIGYSTEFFTSENLSTGRLVAQFRQKVKGDVLFEADTEDGTIAREGESTIVISIPAADTTDFEEWDVYFDLVRESDGNKEAVPGRWKWPVRSTVTRDVV